MHIQMRIAAALDSCFAEHELARSGTEAPGSSKPEIDDQVLVAFEHGDMRAPYQVGSLWTAQEAPPEQSHQEGTRAWPPTLRVAVTPSAA